MQTLKLTETLKNKWREQGFTEFNAESTSMYISNNDTHAMIKITPNRYQIHTEQMNVENDVSELIRETEAYFYQKWTF